MNGQADLVDLFFHAEGRSARLPSILAALTVILVLALYEAAMEPTLHWLTGWFVYPALLYVGACVLSKRLHDRGRSGWFAALILVSVVALWPWPNSFFDFPFVLVALWGFVELAIMPGEQGANRYGPNPLNRLVQA
jgi:uncharacterized membrane protein YhaH (DUF805 family)